MKRIILSGVDKSGNKRFISVMGEFINGIFKIKNINGSLVDLHRIRESYLSLNGIELKQIGIFDYTKDLKNNYEYKKIDFLTLLEIEKAIKNTDEAKRLDIKKIEI